MAVEWKWLRPMSPHRFPRLLAAGTHRGRYRRLSRRHSTPQNDGKLVIRYRFTNIAYRRRALPAHRAFRGSGSARRLKPRLPTAPTAACAASPATSACLPTAYSRRRAAWAHLVAASLLAGRSAKGRLPGRNYSLPGMMVLLLLDVAPYSLNLLSANGEGAVGPLPLEEGPGEELVSDEM